MEPPRIPDNDRLKRHHTLYKLKTPPWKETFREKCHERFRNRRGRLVDKFRGLVFDEARSDDAIDVLMQEDWRTASTEHNPLQNIIPQSPDESYEDGEINEVISIMEEIQKELLEEERRFLQLHAAEENDSFDSTINWLQRDEVICPICQKSTLNQIHSVIFCNCGLRIDVQDGLTLQHLRDQLNKGLDQHEETCQATPSFSLLHLSECTNLAITCGTCHFMYIAI
ncbi:hypothetical protein JTE90_009693 [Oedothorax gibbosus]|uniref:RPA-interacting protein n=1 Tax=Oedothorax gibbosus TaxID=931172 RepID=A0AAV6VA98_9ARAC|nr:hypothetical protein JTE90_009693 [Oedothorax gibbosus]